MCNYNTGLSTQSSSGNWAESFVRSSSLLLSNLTVGFEGEDDNRGSGR